MQKVNDVTISARFLRQRIYSWCLIFFVTVAFFSIQRTEFLIWNWKLFREQRLADILLAFVFGLRFDISASLMMLAPWLIAALIPGFMLSRRSSWLFILFVVIQFPLWILNFSDMESINFVGRRLTASSLFLIREFTGGSGRGLYLTYGVWILLSLLQIFIYFKIIWRHWTEDYSVSWSLRSLSRKAAQVDRQIYEGLHSIWSFIQYLLLCLIVLALSVVGIRGGLQKKPLNFVHAQVFANPILNNLILNSSFTVFKSLKKTRLPREVFFSSPKDMEKYLNGSVQRTSLMLEARPAHKMNIVILILESFALEYMGEINHQQGFTPFMDELAKKSLFFTNAFANGRRSIEGIGAIYTGIPALMNVPFISSEFSSNYFVGLGTVLGQAGYHTSFFHGADYGSTYVDTFMKNAGVTHYFGKNDYPDPQDFDGARGVFDEPFLKFFAKKLSTFREPFFSGLFTLSSHPPYTIPEEYRSQFRPGPIKISASISYTDLALRKFFAAAEKLPWFQNTLFVITADHTQLNYLPEYNNVLGTYRVPLIFYSPGIQWPAGTDTKQPAQHIDIFPSVLDILGIERNSSIWLERSLFVPGEKTVVHFLDPGYIIVNKQNYLLWNRPLEPQMFSIADLKQLHPLLENSEKTNLETRLKATLEYFSQGLWDQKMYYPSK